MTDHVREIQRQLRAAGYPVALDGRWGPETGRAFSAWRAAQAEPPLEVTDAPLPKPDWKSKTIIGIAVSLAAKAAEHWWPDVAIDTAATTDAALELVQIGGLLFAWWGRRKAVAPIRIRRAPSAPVPGGAAGAARGRLRDLEPMPPDAGAGRVAAAADSSDGFWERRHDDGSPFLGD